MKTGIISIIYIFIFSSIYGQSLLSENFSTGIPSGWQVSGSSQSAVWQYNDSLDENGGGCIAGNLGQSSIVDSATIELPSLNIGTLSDPYITFSAALVRANFITPELSLWYSENGKWNKAETWASYPQSGGVPTRATFSGQPLTRDRIEWVHIQYSLKPFRNMQNVKLAFRGEFSNGGWLLLDSINVNNNTYPVAKLPLHEGFESPYFMPIGWQRKGSDYLSDWVRNDSTGAFGVSNSCVNFYSFSNGQSGSIYELQSPWFEIDGSALPSLSFDYAYTKSPNTLSDGLSIWYQVENRQWVLLEELSKTELQTAPDQFSQLEPTPRQWKQKTMQVPLQGFQGKARIAFRYKMENGFILYLDNVRLTDAVSVNNVDNNTVVRVYPNPAHNVLNIELQKGKTITSYSIYDICGRLVLSSDEQLTNTLDISNLQAGMYIINVATDSTRIKDTFTVTR